MDKETAFKKILHFCNYQERCQKEIYDKLKSFELEDADKFFIINFLQEEGFINDERYCRTYVKSKLNLKKWGINKIKLSLISKGIEKQIIDKVLSEIDQDKYKDELLNILINKKINENDLYKRRAKLLRYALSKGYAMDDILEALKILEL